MLIRPLAPVGCPHSKLNMDDNWRLPMGVGQIPPFRTFDEFLHGSGSYNLPISGVQEWNSRMVGNLLYFQTNYIILFMLAVLIALLAFPLDIIYGIGSSGLLAFVIFCSLTVNTRAFEFRRDHPYATLCIIVFCALCFIRALASLVHVVSFACLPLLVIVIHSTIRVRNVMISKNTVYVRNTLMAKLFDMLNVDLRQ
ncbi:hypothetical protein QR680_010956 [Steinernema hermaphroditum]|uniref:PRA1 family protein n=1 Tax=Steinernema hermaphroditum TaxID=289476 RepID=A0AA39ITE3_9BILA|nr:hypothetical protein QR680_010956 [Steinernema hermaphroditum]